MNTAPLMVITERNPHVSGAEMQTLACGHIAIATTEVQVKARRRRCRECLHECPQCGQWMEAGQPMCVGCYAYLDHEWPY